MNGQQHKPTCPRPDKKKHPTQWHAENALTRAWRTGRHKHLPTRAYQCRCGAWHLTSQPPRNHDHTNAA